MWVATFSVTAVRVGLTRGPSGSDSLVVHTRTEARAVAPAGPLRAGPSPEWLSQPILTSVDYRASVWRRTALTKGEINTYPLRHPGNHVSIFTCMDV